jgi:ABC-2 type transport system ATP-binding protein
LGGSGADPAIRARIGYLPAELSVPPSYTARDLVGFFADLRGGLDEASFTRLVERFDLDPTRPAGQLSTGNRRKIGLVQAFVHRPELLILDEPTSGLDPLLQHEFNDLVRSSVAEGATVLLSSHVLPEVEALADRIGILRRGRLISTAKPDELLRRARQRLRLTLAEPRDVTSWFTDVAGVVEVVGTVDGVELIVEGPVGAALRAAAELDVVRIRSDDGEDLEDVFLGFYRGDDLR